MTESTEANIEKGLGTVSFGETVQCGLSIEKKLGSSQKIGKKGKTKTLRKEGEGEDVVALLIT